MKVPSVSVIVTTKNSSRTLSRCLQSIKDQSYRKIEIIVVDNNSTDTSVKIANEYTPHVFIRGPERSEQRNYGVQKSNGLYLLFVDSDMYLSKRVVEQCVNKITTNHLIGVYIPERIKGDSLFSQIRDFERSFYNATVIDAIRFISKGDFVALGGFDISLSAGEDWDLDKKVRQKGQTGIILAPLYHDETQLTLKDYFFKKYSYTHPLKTYINKWGNNDPDIRKQLGLYYRYVGVFIEEGKWKKILRHPFLFISLIFVKGVLGMIYLLTKILKP